MATPHTYITLDNTSAILTGLEDRADIVRSADWSRFFTGKAAAHAPAAMYAIDVFGPADN
jgi:hypothetical protein